MRIREALAPIAAASLLAGCGSHVAHSNESLAPAAKEVATTPAQLDPSIQQANDIEKTLNTFRNRVLFRHQARIALGMCVAWPTTLPDGRPGTTVTLNPGVAGLKQQEFYVFSTHDTHYRPTWGPLNGPEFLSPEAEVVIMTRGLVIDAKSERSLSFAESHDEVNKSGYYSEVNTGQPVMDTILLPGEVAGSGLKRVCLELKSKKKINPQPVSQRA